MLIDLLAIVLWGAAGYLAVSAFYAPSVVTVAELRVPTAAESKFIGEWKQLHATPGDDTAALYAAIMDTKDSSRRQPFLYTITAEW